MPASRPATPAERRRIGAIFLALAVLGIAAAVAIALGSGHVWYGIAALIAWGLAIIVVGVLAALVIGARNKN